MSKKRDYTLFLYDIVSSIERVEKYTTGLSKKKFLEHEIISDATVRNMEVIGEAARNIPEEVRRLSPNIPWKKIVGFRNIVIHEYFFIDLENVWFIAKKQLPELKKQIKNLLNEIKSK